MVRRSRQPRQDGADAREAEGESSFTARARTGERRVGERLAPLSVLVVPVMTCTRRSRSARESVLLLPPSAKCMGRRRRRLLLCLPLGIGVSLSCRRASSAARLGRRQRHHPESTEIELRSTPKFKLRVRH